MARIRTIKPDYFSSRDIVRLSPLARLLYIGLWCEADREGRLRYEPETFKYRYLPGDDCDAAAVVGELLASGLVVLYGDGLAYVPTFKRHQVINGKEAPSILPAPPTARVTEIDPRVSDACLTRPGGKEGNGKEGNGREGGAAVAAFPSPVPMSNDAWHETIADWNAAITATALPPVPPQPASWRRIVTAVKLCPDLNLWRQRYERVAASAFCRGTNDRAWSADFWWVLEHGDAIDAGRYDDRAVTSGKVAGLAGGGVPANRVSVGVHVIDPDYNGAEYRFHCGHSPACTTWPQCRDREAVAS
jgi:hypothetical protein